MPTPNENAVVSMGNLDVSSGQETPEQKAAREAAAAAPQPVEITLDGKTYKVDTAVKAALDAARQSGVDMDALRTQLTELRTTVDAQRRGPVKASSGTSDGMDIDTLLFTDTKKAIALIRQSILQEVGGAMSVQQSQTQFWQEFYKANKDLTDHDAYVRYVFQREYQSMAKAGLTVGKTIEKLGEMVKGDILKLKGEQKGKGKPPVAEGGSEGTRGGKPAPSEESEDSPSVKAAKVSTASILADRRAARAAANKPGKRK